MFFASVQVFFAIVQVQTLGFGGGGACLYIYIYMYTYGKPLTSVTNLATNIQVTSGLGAGVLGRRAQLRKAAMQQLRVRTSQEGKRAEVSISKCAPGVAAPKGKTK